MPRGAPSPARPAAARGPGRRRRCPSRPPPPTTSSTWPASIDDGVEARTERAAARTGAADDGAGGGADAAARSTGEALEAFSIDLAHNRWKLGQKGKDNGVLLDARDAGAPLPHRGRLRPGRRAAGQPRRQSSAGEVLVPAFRAGDYGGGLARGGRRAGGARRRERRGGAPGGARPRRRAAAGAPAAGGRAGPAGERCWRCLLVPVFLSADPPPAAADPAAALVAGRGARQRLGGGGGGVSAAAAAAASAAAAPRAPGDGDRARCGSRRASSCPPAGSSLRTPCADAPRGPAPRHPSGLASGRASRSGGDSGVSRARGGVAPMEAPVQRQEVAVQCSGRWSLVAAVLRGSSPLVGSRRPPLRATPPALAWTRAFVPALERSRACHASG